MESFAFRKDSGDGRAYSCKDCQKTYSKRHYANNKQSYIDQSRKQRQVIQSNLMTYKGQRGCNICGESRPWVLDFHHLDPSVKEDDIGALKRKGNWNEIKAEIAKCVVVCRNCHADIHYCGVEK